MKEKICKRNSSGMKKIELMGGRRMVEEIEVIQNKVKRILEGIIDGEMGKNTIKEDSMMKKAGREKTRDTNIRRALCA